MQTIENRFPIFSDLSGRLLDGGRVFIGEVGEDPERRPVPVFWDTTSSIPAAQPLRTVAGYIGREGTPSRVFTPGTYSIRVRQQDGREVYFSPNGTGGQSLTDFDGGLFGTLDGDTFDGGNYGQA